MEIGVFTFGDLIPDPVTGKTRTPGQKMREVVRMAKLADEVGLDVFAVGEHHRLDMVLSSPAVALAAIAEATERIQLSSATTLLNTLDPVRVFEDFATLDLLSGGRAEILVGRGSFTESFALFGYDMRDYDDLFVEKLDLLLRINAQERVTWSGRHRPPLQDAEVAPRPARPLPVWVGVGGTPQSAYRAGALGLPMNLAILGGPERFTGLAALHRQGAAEAGRPQPALAVSSHGLLADEGAEAKRKFGRHWGDLMRKGLRNRFPPRDLPQEYLEMEMGPRGAFFAGTAEEAVEKIRWERRVLGIDRLLLNLDWGGVPLEETLRAIEILGTEVAPKVRAERGSTP